MFGENVALAITNFIRVLVGLRNVLAWITTSSTSLLRTASATNTSRRNFGGMLSAG